MQYISLILKRLRIKKKHTPDANFTEYYTIVITKNKLDYHDNIKF